MSPLFSPHRARRAASDRMRRGRRRRPAASVVRPGVESLEGRLLLTGRPSYNTGTGFFVVGRNIYDANGNPFDIRGFNQTQWWGNPTNNYASIAEVPKTQANAVRVVFGPGFGATTPAQRAAVVGQYVAEGVVPIVEDHGATSGMDLNSLNAVVDRWLDPANVQWLKQDEKYVILDIANEWGPVDYLWAQGYESAIGRLRAAGINCLLMVDAGGYGQGFDDILTWGQQILDSDPQHNVVFDIHMYGDWATEDSSQVVGTSDGRTPYDMNTELLKAVAENIPLVVGEFTWNPSSAVSTYSTQRAMQIFQTLDIGWLAWSWNQNNDPALSMVANEAYQYTSNADLTPFGNLIINDPTYGLKATARRASIFPPGVTVAPNSNLETTQVGGTAEFSIVLNSPPASGVTIPLSSSDTTEGTVSPTSLTFTPADWNVPQTVTVTGVNDGLDRGNVAYRIVPGAATSQDPSYNGLVASDVAVTNIDTDGPVQVVDNGHAGWSDVGPWIPGGPGSGFGGDSNVIPPGIGANTATWTFAVTPGLYRIASTWPASSAAADNAPFTILNNGTNLGVLRVDQQTAPGDFSADGANWKDLGLFVVSGGTLQVQLSDDADGNVIADAVRIERLSDTIVNVAASPASVPEDGTTGLVYTFARAGSTGGALTVSFGVGGTAAFGTDYTESGAATFTATSGTVTFAPGSATATVTLYPVADSDLVVDGDQSVILTVSAGGAYAVGSPGAATGIITDDNTDAQVTVAASPASVPEDGTTGLVYTFTRAGSTGGALTASFGVGGTAVFGTDYTESGAATFGATAGTVTFAPGSATATVTLYPVDDSDLVEGDRSIVLTVSAGGAYGIGSSSSATTVITDVQVTAAVSPAAVAEDGAAGLVYTFTRTGSAAGALTVSFGVGGTAVLGTDYTESGATTFGATAGTVTFAPGSDTATVTLVPIADSEPDLDETAVLTLSYGSGYALGSPRVATGAITDDRIFANISCFPTWVAKDGANKLVYTFSRTGSTAGALTVSFGVGGTAVLGTDYTVSGATTFGATAGTVTFAPGSATATVTLAPLPDNKAEPDETAVLSISAGTGYLVGGYSQATGTITDTNAFVSVVVSPASVPSGGTTGLVYTFTRTGSAAGALTASFGVGGTAVFGTDYTESGAATFGATAGTVTFAPGSATATVTLYPVDEHAVDDDETAILMVSAGIGSSIGSSSSATGTITSNIYYSGTASFVKQDAATQGTWIGTYGAQGYDIAGGPANLPGYATVTPSGQSTYTWTNTSSDPRALQVPGSSNRIAAVWYSATSFVVDVNLTDGTRHDLELYFADWDNKGHAETVQISDAATGAVLSTQSISSFASGVYLDYAVSGHIVITITRQAGASAVLSGLFLDPAPPPATFIKQDATTQGTWIGTYGAQAFDIIGGPASLLGYATVTPSGQSGYVWTKTSSDPRALQVPGSSSRIAAVWYSATSFVVDVNLTDGAQHDLELYFADWDNRGRAETVQVSDAATGAVLSTQSISSFASGVYLDYAVSGHIFITITRQAGPNAVLNGLFLDPAPPPLATFIKQDATTQGTWINTYGAQGYDIVGGPASLPGYATVTPSGQSGYIWTKTSSDPRALQVPGSSSRIAAVWYSTTSFVVDVNVTDGARHDLEFYFADWDNRGRAETVQVSDATTGAVLSTQSITSFRSGVYLDYAVSGHIVITITNQAGPNAVLNGLFLDSATPPATYIKQDAATQGTWIGTYGAQSYDIAGGPASLPGYATVTPLGQSTYVWTKTSSDPHALQVPGSSGRITAVWYSATSFVVDVNVTDGAQHDLELYFADWDNRGRAETVQVNDAATGAVLSTQSITSFGSGVYLDYAVSGHVLITITNQAGPSAVLNGLFLDPASPPPATLIKQDAATQGTWIGTYGAQGYDIAGGPASLPGYAAVTPSGQSTYTWTKTSSDPRALQVPGSSGRIAAVWYSATSFVVDVNVTDGARHDLEFYFADWDNGGRAEAVQVSDAATGAVLSTLSISSFGSGVYLDYAVSGHVLITITRQAGANAVLSGLFLDPAPPPPATLIKQDVTTQGTWIGTYGAQGYDIASGPASLPGYATVTPSGQSGYIWTKTSSDPRALQVPESSNRIAAVWYSATSFVVDVNLSDGARHDLELYFADWDNRGRAETVQVSDAATGAVLSTLSISSFASGVYLDYAVSGHIVITITRQAGPNAVLNGLFLG